MWAWYDAVPPALSGSLCSSAAGNTNDGGGDGKTVPCSTYYLREAKINPGLLFCPDAPRVSPWGALQTQLEGWRVGVGGGMGADLLFSSQTRQQRNG